jgi:hypothetical protein
MQASTGLFTAEAQRRRGLEFNVGISTNGDLNRQEQFELPQAGTKGEEH